MIDEFVGKLLATLEYEGLTDDTIILFTSDHGEMLGAHGLWHKMVPFEESIRVPLLMQLPGGAAGRHLSMPASLVDIAPTLANLCDLPDADWQGRDLFSEDQDGSESPAIFAMHKPLGEWMHTTDWRMIRRDGLKYVWHRGFGDELFDLVADTGERVNHIASQDYQSRLTLLQDELDKFLQATNDPLLAEWQAERRASGGEGMV
jgi:choline-sulfatase